MVGRSLVWARLAIPPESRDRTCPKRPLSHPFLPHVVSRSLNSLRQALSGSFFRAVTVLSSGALIAQIISFAGGAVLARYMYPPAVQDLQSTFYALLATLAPIMTLRYDAAVVLAQREIDARHVCWLNLLIAVATTFAVTFVVLGVAIWSHTATPALWALPLAALAQGISQPVLTWCTRKGLFIIQSAARIGQAIAVPVTGALAFVAFGGQPENLPWAMTISLCLSCAFLLFLLSRADSLPWRLRERPSRTTLASLAGEYRRLPLASTPMNFVDLASQAALVWCLAHMSDGVSACYALTLTLLRAPMLLLGTSVSQVYASRAAQLVDKPAELRKLTLKTVLGMSVPASFLTVFFMVAGPWFFTFIYGPQWSLSGKFSQLLVWGFAFNLLSSPISILPTILSKNLYHLLLMAGLGATRVAVSLVAFQHGDPHELVRNVAIVEVLFNILLVVFFFAITHSHAKRSVVPSHSGAA